MKWVSSFEAVKQLRAAEINDPMILAVWAERCLIRARTNHAECDGEECKGLREIPSDFWRWVRIKGEKFWDAGIFAATVQYEPDRNHRISSNHWRLSAVTFHQADLKKQIRNLNLAPDQDFPEPRVTKSAFQENWWKPHADKNATEKVLWAAAKVFFTGKTVPRKHLRDELARLHRSRGRPKRTS